MKTTGAILFCLLLASCKSASNNSNVEAVRSNGHQFTGPYYGCEKDRGTNANLTIKFNTGVSDKFTVVSTDVGVKGPVEMKDSGNGNYEGSDEDGSTLNIKDIPANRAMKFSMKFKYHLAEDEADGDSFQTFKCRLLM